VISGLKALRAVKFLTYCAAVMDALAAAIPLLLDVIAVAAFLMAIFGIMGVQAMACKLKYYCQAPDGENMVPETGCSEKYPCPSGFSCGEVRNQQDDLDL